MEYSIETLLKENGIEPVYRKTEYGFYLSPLRIEKEPSFKVDYRKNLWYDFGIGEGGNVYTLYTLLNSCTIQEAKAKLSACDDSLKPYFTKKEKRDMYANPSSLQVTSNELLHSPSLLSYLEERHIPNYIARAYCSELTVKNGEKQHLVIGFKNDLGGWEMRNRYLKICSSPKYFSTIAPTPTWDVCNVFEGFIDFLSLATVSGVDGVNGKSYILNSVTNISKCLNDLRRFKHINSFLDNDHSGRETLRKIKDFCENSSVVDCSAYYRGYKDLNDFLVGKPIVIQKEKDELQNRFQPGF